MLEKNGRVSTVLISFADVCEKINQIKYNRIARQTGVYSIMQVFSLGMGFLINVFLAKEMGVDQFGIYSFAVAVMSFVGILFEFGFFSTAAKILADNQNPVEERHWLGIFFLFFLVINVGMVSFVFLLSFGIDYLFTDKIGSLLTSVCIFSYVYTLPSFMELVLKGNNRIYALSGFNFLQRVFSLFILAGLWFWGDLEPFYIFYMMGISYLIAFLSIYFSMKPKFTSVSSYVRRYISYNAEYGWQLYWGRIADVGAYNLDKILIPYFIDARTVGLYTLAYSFAAPILTIPNALVASTFRAFAEKAFIPQNIMRNNVCMIIFSCLSVGLVGYVVLVCYLPQGYEQSFYYLLILILAFAVQGGYGLYNAWLAVRGHVILLRNFSWRIATVDVFANFFLIMWMGGYGGCIAALMEKSYYYYLVRGAYRKLCDVSEMYSEEGIR